ncbi:hypothetical protein AAFF_G00097790 [Aldrovandia affinis]|uniref:Uncharacterized protein n=1 Tax=Aldrovandia affinis TaxID=143900 RepID=A0AAD7WBG7_9TELE|nr:hypothetical protein AAFF_G00097790 [Aldrovandia affinis]
MLTNKSGSSYSRRLTLAQQQLARFTDSRSSRSRRRVPRQQLATFTDSQSRRRRRVPRQQLDRFNSGRRYTVSQIRPPPAEKSAGRLAIDQGWDAQLFGQQLSSRLSRPTTPGL